VIHHSPTVAREESRQGGNLGIIEINAAPPPLDLSPEEIAALADELVDDHTAFADLYDRKEQAHWGYKAISQKERPSLWSTAV
jgi:hypothetical protein